LSPEGISLRACPKSLDASFYPWHRFEFLTSILRFPTHAFVYQQQSLLRRPRKTLFCVMRAIRAIRGYPRPADNTDRADYADGQAR